MKKILLISGTLILVSLFAIIWRNVSATEEKQIQPSQKNPTIEYCLDRFSLSRFEEITNANSDEDIALALPEGGMVTVTSDNKKGIHVIDKGHEKMINPHTNPDAATIGEIKQALKDKEK